jgi:L-malate glycosyltransferase
MAVTVNQWFAAAHSGDAIGDHARRVQAVLRGMGHAAELYALTIDSELRDVVRPFGHRDARCGDVTILHFTLPSAMTEAFASLPRGRVLQYHNITPGHFFDPYDAALARLVRVGRQHLATLAGRVDLALGVSEYNRLELEAMGFAPTGVMPIAIDTDRLTKALHRPALEEVLHDGLDNFLFVGRIAPNKKIEDYVKLAEHYRRYVDPDYRFIFAGRYDAVPHYYSTVRALIREYDFPPDRFVFTGPVPNEELATYYRTARVYVSLSEHEGFCVPLLEAMAADVPVLAYASTAIPDTLGGAGVQFSPKDLEFAAELLGVLASDEGVRLRVIEGQRKRLADFGDARTERDLRSILARVT